jgi:hypothetical protein
MKLELEGILRRARGPRNHPQSVRYSASGQEIAKRHAQDGGRRADAAQKQRSYKSGNLRRASQPSGRDSAQAERLPLTLATLCHNRRRARNHRAFATAATGRLRSV